MIKCEVGFKDHTIFIGDFRILTSNRLVLMRDTEMIAGSVWHKGYLFGTIEQAISYCLSQQSPPEPSKD